MLQPNSINEAFDFSNIDDSGGMEDGCMTKVYFSRFKRLEQTCAFYNVIGVLGIIIDYELQHMNSPKMATNY